MRPVAAEYGSLGYQCDHTDDKYHVDDGGASEHHVDQSLGR